MPDTLKIERVSLHDARHSCASLMHARHVPIATIAVSSGRTLQENGLVEVEMIAQVSARLIANRVAFKTRPEVAPLIDAFRAAAGAARAA